MAYSQNFEELERFIEAVRLEYQVPDVAVSIVDGDKVVFAKGFGGTVNKDTIFQLASVTKSFTAAAFGPDNKATAFTTETLGLFKS